MTMFAAGTLGLIVTMVLALVRGLLGPTVFDRILAANAFGTLTVLLIAMLGFLAGRPEFTDIALVYALINFISTIAVIRYVRHGPRGEPIGGGGDEASDI
jgi:multicomponent Na+:H+ antiporter subunit F